MKSPHFPGVLLGVCLAGLAARDFATHGTAATRTSPVETRIDIHSLEHAEEESSLDSPAVTEIRLAIANAFQANERSDDVVVVRTALESSYGASFHEEAPAIAYWVEYDKELMEYVLRCTGDHTFSVDFGTETVMVMVDQTVTLK